MQQRSETLVDRETQDNQGQDPNHSPQDIQAAEVPSTVEKSQDQERSQQEAMPVGSRRAKLKLPPANSKQWEDLDSDLEQVLESILRGTTKEKLVLLPKIVYDVCVDRFGSDEKGTSAPKRSGPSRRQKQIREIRKDLRRLRHWWKGAEDQEKDGLYQLREELRKRSLTLRRPERLRKAAREKAGEGSILYRSIQVCR